MSFNETFSFSPHRLSVYIASFARPVHVYSHCNRVFSDTFAVALPPLHTHIHTLSSSPSSVCISLMYFGGLSQSSLFAQGHITSHFAGQILSRNLREFQIWLFEIAKIRPSCLKPRARNPRL